MKSLILHAMTIATMLSSAAQAQMTCGQVLRDSGLALSTKGFEADQQNNKSDLADKTLRLLQMIAATRDESFSQKMTQEKGELLLGENIQNGYSLEYEYFADRREVNEVFRLGAIYLVRPNGEKSAILKKPTTTNGTGFSKSRLSEEDLATDGLGEGSPFSYLKEVSAPTVIQGELYKSLMTWAPRAEFLLREDIHNLHSASQLKSLRGKVYLRSSYELGKKIVKKQSMKFLILAAAIYIYTNEGDRAKDILTSLQDPWSGIAADTNLADIKALMPVLDVKILPQAKPTPLIDLNKTLRAMNLLIKREKELGGKPTVFTLSAGKPKEINLKRVSKSIQDAAETGDHVVILHLPIMKRVVFVQGDEEDSTRMQVMGLAEQSSPEAYAQLKTLLKD